MRRGRMKDGSILRHFPSKKPPKTLQKWEVLGLCLFIFGKAQADGDLPEQLLVDVFAFSFPS